MQVRGAKARARAFGIVAAVGGLAGFIADGALGSLRGAELSPAEVVSQRFPTGWGSMQSAPSPDGAGGAKSDPVQPAQFASTRGIDPIESTRGSAPAASARLAAPLPLPRPAAAGRPATAVASAPAAQVPGGDLFFNPSIGSVPVSGPAPVLAYADPAAPAKASSGYQLASASAVPEKRTPARTA